MTVVMCAFRAAAALVTLDTKVTRFRDALKSTSCWLAVCLGATLSKLHMHTSTSTVIASTQFHVDRPRIPAGRQQQTHQKAFSQSSD